MLRNSLVSEWVGREEETRRIPERLLSFLTSVEGVPLFRPIAMRAIALVAQLEERRTAHLHPELALVWRQLKLGEDGDR